jgi:hypothetical protein
MGAMSDKMVVGASDTGSKETAKEYGLSVFKGLVGAIPFAGTAINELLFEARSRLKQRRVKDFVAAVAEDVTRLTAEGINREFLASEDFSDLIEDIFIRVSRTKSAERRNHYKSILVRAFQGLSDPDFSTFFLNVLEEITEQEVTILRGFAKYLAEKPKYDARGEKLDVGAIDYAATQWGLDGVVAKQLVQALIAKGLLADTSAGYYDGEAFTHIIPTELGARFLAWLGT